MARRKSVCSKWTLILIIVVFCPFVYPRPQETSTSLPIANSTSSAQKDITTLNPERYKDNYYKGNISIVQLTLPIVISFVNNSNFISKNNFNTNSSNNSAELGKRVNINKRKSRLISNRIKNTSTNSSKNNRNRNKIAFHSKESIEYVNTKNMFDVSSESNRNDVSLSRDRMKPTIKKVITKWTDKTNYEDLNFSYEISSEENNKHPIKLTTAFDHDYSSTENINSLLIDAGKNQFYPQSTNKLITKLSNKNNSKPKPQYSEETQVYSNNLHIIDSYPFLSSRPTYIFSTPTPTPIITNVGNPKPWPQQNFQTVYRKPTQKPILIKKPVKDQYNYHNSMHNYPSHPSDDFEVTTFQPSTAYTDRIVIRPEEYSNSPDDCPTIFLTLNNTFQGQAKEACPDLNIAVNTNVINKNVIIESEEDETDSLFPGAFGIPLDDDSGTVDDIENNSENEDSPTNDYFESDENLEEPESASVEATQLTNYNAVNGALQSDSAESGSIGSLVGSPGSPISNINRPSRPSSDDDDVFSMSSLMQFFKPTMNILGWLAAINPLSFGFFSLLIAPIALLFTGASGLTALFAPWALPYAREVHLYKPQWQWDDETKSWYLTSSNNNKKKWNSRLPKNSNEVQTQITNSIKPTLFYNIKQWMNTTAQILRNKNKTMQNNRKNKRKRREIWTMRIK